MECYACHVAMQSLGQLPIRTGGTSGGWHLLLGDWADAMEGVLPLDVLPLSAMPTSRVRRSRSQSACDLDGKANVNDSVVTTQHDRRRGDAPTLKP